MKPTRRLALGTLTALAVLGATTGAGADDVTVDFSVTAAAGGLSVASATGTATAGSSSYDSGSAGSITGSMPAVTVTDARGTLLTGWQVDVVAAANFDDGADDDANDGSNSIAATNAVVFVPVGSLADTALQRVTDLLADPGNTATVMTVSDCVCDATGSVALAAYDLGSSYTLVSGIASALTSTPSLVFAPDIHISVPANTPVGSYSANVTYTAS